MLGAKQEKLEKESAPPKSTLVVLLAEEDSEIETLQEMLFSDYPWAAKAAQDGEVLLMKKNWFEVYCNEPKKSLKDISVQIEQPTPEPAPVPVISQDPVLERKATIEMPANRSMTEKQRALVKLEEMFNEEL